MSNERSSDGNKAVAPRKGDTLITVRAELERAAEEGRLPLPGTMQVALFLRAADLHMQKNKLILAADPRSIFNALMYAAVDGLLPDGREGAIVPFKNFRASKTAGHDIYEVQWMPMVAGIMKKARNSGEIASISAHVVYAGDQFRNWVDDDGEHVLYESMPDHDRDAVRAVFARCKLKSGEQVIEVLSPADVEKIRAVSKAKDDGPWVAWWEEMAKKSAIRRLAKRLPASTDLLTVITRDDSLYDLPGQAVATRVAPRVGSLQDRMAALPSGRSAVTIDPINEPDRVGQPAEKGAGQKASPSANGPAPDPSDDDPGDDDPSDDQVAEAEKRGRAAALNGASPKAMPREYRDSDVLSTAWAKGHAAASAEADEGGEG